MGSTGDSADNALAETINGLYKAEIRHRRGPWETREAVELASLVGLSWFNHHRLFEPIGYIQPAEAEAAEWRQHAQASATTKPARAAARQQGRTLSTGPNRGPPAAPAGAGRERVQRPKHPT